MSSGKVFRIFVTEHSKDWGKATVRRDIFQFDGMTKFLIRIIYWKVTVCVDEASRLKFERPVSWTSQSSESSLSSRDLASNPDHIDRWVLCWLILSTGFLLWKISRISPGDTNNNPPSPRSLPEINGVNDFTVETILMSNVITVTGDL